MRRPSLLLVVVALVLMQSTAPVSGYYLRFTAEENAKLADIVLTGELLEVSDGPTLPGRDSKIVFLKIRVDELVKYHTYDQDVILVAHEQPIERGPRCPAYYTENDARKSYLWFLDLVPVYDGRHGYRSHFTLNEGYEIREGVVEVLRSAEPWDWGAVPLGELIHDLRAASPGLGLGSQIPSRRVE